MFTLPKVAHCHQKNTFFVPSDLLADVFGWVVRNVCDSYSWYIHMNEDVYTRNKKKNSLGFRGLIDTIKTWHLRSFGVGYCRKSYQFSSMTYILPQRNFSLMSLVSESSHPTEDMSFIRRKVQLNLCTSIARKKLTWNCINCFNIFQHIVFVTMKNQYYLDGTRKLGTTLN